MINNLGFWLIVTLSKGNFVKVIVQGLWYIHGIPPQRSVTSFPVLICKDRLVLDIDSGIARYESLTQSWLATQLT